MKRHHLRVAFAALCFAVAALPTRAADVALGDAVFNETSDQGTAECYEPLTVGVVLNFEGFGANEGNTRTEEYLAGGLVAGVKTVRRRVTETTLAGTATEDWWLAYDVQDNVRVLKMARSGAVAFQASASQAPPIFLPANPVKNDRWIVFGETIVVEYPDKADSTALLRLKVTAGGQAYSVNYSCGVGRTVTDFGEGSGWNLKSL